MKRLVQGLSAIAAAMLLSALMTTAAFADEENNNTNTQTGVNVATSTQAVAGISGDAVAADSSVAASGNVSVWADSYQAQAIIQVGANQVLIGDCECLPSPNGDVLNNNSNDQVAANDALSDQAGVGVSGNAVAVDDSVAVTGNLDVGAINTQEQFQVQVGLNQVVVDLSSLFGGMAA